ncbi:hypothetical protein BMETH_479_1 [methanotrophic bacterial endosymbiont of Bathymodiolus sp.]|nr:hypothetical protein BMETH_479_1 [methanotrophic bacterial endosymbiont of Bathymodiolus sp.]
MAGSDSKAKAIVVAQYNEIPITAAEVNKAQRFFKHRSIIGQIIKGIYTRVSLAPKARLS